MNEFTDLWLQASTFDVVAKVLDFVWLSLFDEGQSLYR